MDFLVGEDGVLLGGLLRESARWLLGRRLQGGATLDEGLDGLFVTLGGSNEKGVGGIRGEEAQVCSKVCQQFDSLMIVDKSKVVYKPIPFVINLIYHTPDLSPTLL